MFPFFRILQQGNDRPRLDQSRLNLPISQSRHEPILLRWILIILMLDLLDTRPVVPGHDILPSIPSMLVFVLSVNAVFISFTATL